MFGGSTLDASPRHYGQMWLWWGETSGRAAEHDAALIHAVANKILRKARREERLSGSGRKVKIIN